MVHYQKMPTEILRAPFTLNKEYWYLYSYNLLYYLKNGFCETCEGVAWAINVFEFRSLDLIGLQNKPINIFLAWRRVVFLLARCCCRRERRCSAHSSHNNNATTQHETFPREAVVTCRGNQFYCNWVGKSQKAFSLLVSLFPLSWSSSTNNNKQ